MMNRPFIPAFLKNLDRKLLMNDPMTWSSRIHLVSWYGLLSIIILTLLFWIMPDDQILPSAIGTATGFMALVSLILLVVYLVFLLRFNVFKRFGSGTGSSALKEFLQYLVCIGLIVLLPYIYPVVEKFKADHYHPTEELLRDINALNRNIIITEMDSLDHQWRVDTTVYTGNPLTNKPPAETVTSPQIDVAAAAPRNSRRPVNKDELDRLFFISDSVQRLNDSMWIFMFSPNYLFIQPYNLGSNEGLAKNKDIYYNVVLQYKPEQAPAAHAEKERLVRKYALPEYDAYYHRTEDRTERMRIRNSVNAVNAGLTNIFERKNRFEGYALAGFTRSFLYISIILTLLLFAFRHSTPKAFFLALLAAFCLTILTTLINVFFSYGRFSFPGAVCIFFSGFLIYTLVLLRTPVRSITGGIALNLFLWTLPFIPMCIVYLAYEDYSTYNSHSYEKYQRAMQNAEILGLILLLVMIPLYINTVYRRWFSAPVE